MKKVLNGALLAARVLLAANPACAQPIDKLPVPHGGADAIWFALAAPSRSACGRTRLIETNRRGTPPSARGPQTTSQPTFHGAAFALELDSPSI